MLAPDARSVGPRPRRGTPCGPRRCRPVRWPGLRARCGRSRARSRESAISSATSAFCSTSSTVVPCSLTSLMVSKTDSTSTGARPIDGSSSSSSRGAAISARPIASICCSPPDSVPAFCVRRSFSRGNRSKTRSMSVAIVALVVAQERAELEVLRAPSCAGRCAGPPGSGRCPARTTSCAFEPVISLALEVHLAASRLEQPGDRAHRGRLAGTVGADQGDDLARVDGRARCP